MLAVVSGRRLNGQGGLPWEGQRRTDGEGAGQKISGRILKRFDLNIDF